MAPKDVTKTNENYILNSVYLQDQNIRGRAKFKIGNYVRVSKNKSPIFSKGYRPNWSNEIFVIKQVQNTSPYTYLLEDAEGRPIKGGFYSEELQKTMHPDVYLIEKVLKRTKDRIYVSTLE